MDKELLSKDVTNLDAVICSIQTDYYVYKWFSFLLETPEVMAQLKQREGASAHYSSIHLIFFLQVLFYTIFILCAFYIFSAQQYHLAVILVIFLSAGWGLCYLKKRHSVKLVELFLTALTADFEKNGINHTTLYQLSEFYSKKYSTVSLVDVIYTSETAMRATLKTCYVVILCVLTINVWIALLAIPLCMFLIFFFINSIPFYKRLTSVKFNA